MKYLILCDIDGTLLNNQSKLTQNTIDYIKEISNNHYFCLITSSSYQKVLPIYNTLGLNTHMVCKNGGLIINPKTNDRLVFALKNDEILKYFNDLKHIITSMFYKCEGDAYCYNFIDKYKYIMAIPENVKINHGDYNELNLSNSTNLYIIIDVNNCNILEEYFSNLGLRVDCMGKDRKIAIYMITHKLALKHKAIDFFKEEYIFDKLISFGDSQFDVEMLKASDIGFLMKNSTSIDYIIKTEYTNNEDGVIKELQKIIE